MHFVFNRGVTGSETFPRRGMIGVGFDAMVLQTAECGRELTRLAAPITAPPSRVEHANVAGVERSELDGGGANGPSDARIAAISWKGTQPSPTAQRTSRKPWLVNCA